MVGEKANQIYILLGDLLDYPDDQLRAYAQECEQIFKRDFPISSSQIRKFIDFMESTTLGRMEEIYTSTFDVSPTCFIFAGYMLFGETFKRGEFLVQLQEKYRQHNFSMGDELADHIAVIFRFLATLEFDDILKLEIIEDCLLPVMEKMISSFNTEAKRANPYVHILQASIAALEHDLRRGSAHRKLSAGVHAKEMVQ